MPKSHTILDILADYPVIPNVRLFYNRKQVKRFIRDLLDEVSVCQDCRGDAPEVVILDTYLQMRMVCASCLEQHHG